MSIIQYQVEWIENKFIINRLNKNWLFIHLIWCKIYLWIHQIWCNSYNI